jgi:uncharacterized protein (DUF58 family)
VFLSHEVVAGAVELVTLRGWILVGGCVAAILAGRILGIAELYGLALAGLVLVLLARIYVSRGPGELTVWTKASPQVARLGEAARLDVRVHNVSRRRSRGALLRDLPYRGQREPIRVGDINVSPLEAAESARILLELPTVRRGAFELPNIGLAFEDPLGLACRTRGTGAEARLVVLPLIEELPELAPSGDMTDREEASRSAAVRLRTGLSSFRLYEQGDDLRRVHWKTTARVGELMVREGGDPESPESRSVTVVLDCRRSIHTAATFETAVSAAASVIDTAASYGSAIRLITTAGVDTDIVLDEADVEAALTELAVASVRDSYGGVVAHIGSGRIESKGIVVAITTPRCSAEDAARLCPTRRGSDDVMVVVDEPGLAGAGVMTAASTVKVNAGASVAAAWRRTVASVAADRLAAATADEQPSEVETAGEVAS